MSPPIPRDIHPMIITAICVLILGGLFWWAAKQPTCADKVCPPGTVAERAYMRKECWCLTPAKDPP